MKVTNGENGCALGAVVAIVSGKWKGHILWAVRAGPRRFGELKRSVPGASEKVLIQQLRELETDGIIRRTAYEETPPRVEYSLTELGTSLNELLLPLGEWAHANLDLPTPPPEPLFIGARRRRNELHAARSPSGASV